MDKFVLEFKKMSGEECARASISLSEKAAEMIRTQLKNREKHIERFDERGKFLELIDKYSIKSIKKIGEENDSEYTRFAVCPYGTRHKHLGKLGFEECHCENRFKLNPFLFEKLMREHYKIEYPNDITADIQRDAEEYIHKCIDNT